MENNDPDNNFWSRRRWLQRLAFSFLIVGLYLVYTAYHHSVDHTFSRNRVILCYFSAMLCFVMFVMGAKERRK